jgi:hypothetical protein
MTTHPRPRTAQLATQATIAAAAALLVHQHGFLKVGGTFAVFCLGRLYGGMQMVRWFHRRHPELLEQPCPLCGKVHH